ncbi:hypothetical protein MBRU_09645 [Mycolicibacterium brumae DSM 44177]|nr:hypothetical protein MBRU_09645 [Mycolicibacterium brumae DSM 44177]
MLGAAPAPQPAEPRTVTVAVAGLQIIVPV